MNEIDGVPTGLAFLCVDDAGENTIVVSAGANAALKPSHVYAELFEQASVVTLCFEVDHAVITTARNARHAGATVILNLSLARQLDKDLAALVDVLVVNELELEAATGIASTLDDPLGQALVSLGVPTLVVTPGSAGAAVATQDENGTFAVERISSIAVHAVDTTGCGDAFLGALTSEVAEGLPIREAVRTATLVGAYAATRFGAQLSYPTRKDLDSWIESFCTSV